QRQAENNPDHHRPEWEGKPIAEAGQPERDVLAAVIDRSIQARPRLPSLTATVQVDVSTHARAVLQGGTTTVQIDIPAHLSRDIYVRAKGKDIASHLACHIQCATKQREISAHHLTFTHNQRLSKNRRSLGRCTVTGARQIPTAGALDPWIQPAPEETGSLDQQPRS